MQRFPKDSRDNIEKKYASDVLKLFPSYGIFWEKIVGVDITNKLSLLPKVPTFPRHHLSSYDMKYK